MASYIRTFTQAEYVFALKTLLTQILLLSKPVWERSQPQLTQHRETGPWDILAQGLDEAVSEANLAHHPFEKPDISGKGRANHKPQIRHFMWNLLLIYSHNSYSLLPFPISSCQQSTSRVEHVTVSCFVALLIYTNNFVMSRSYFFSSEYYVFKIHT